MISEKGFKKLAIAVSIAVPLSLSMVAGSVHAQAKNGTTLAAYKTIDICSVDSSTWRYFGEIAIWNEGAVDTQGIVVTDWIQTKNGSNWTNAYQVNVQGITNIPAGTTTAMVFPYSVEYPALPNGVRNDALIQISNHSGSVGTLKGPNPKATFLGEVKPCPVPGGGCTYTQGYWGNKPDVVWPAPYVRENTFFMSGQTWQQVLTNSVNTSPGYYQVASQYIAAVLNKASGSPVPNGVQSTLDLAEGWLSTNGPDTCTAKGSCGVQKDWAAVLDLYNNGKYEGGPGHCE